MLGFILRHFSFNFTDKVSCRLHFGARRLRRMRWHSSQLFHR
ncbi:hypothetical protein [Geopsychrobacter electrodiphilus]|nr:hypothetical protein [Geopsychrobacter electrodiphilus]